MEEPAEKKQRKEPEISKVFPHTKTSDFVLTVTWEDASTIFFLSKFFLEQIGSPVINEWIVDNDDLQMTDFHPRKYERFFRLCSVHPEKGLDKSFDREIARDVTELAFKFEVKWITDRCFRVLPESGWILGDVMLLYRFAPRPVIDQFLGKIGFDAVSVWCEFMEEWSKQGYHGLVKDITKVILTKLNAKR